MNDQGKAMDERREARRLMRAAKRLRPQVRVKFRFQGQRGSVICSLDSAEVIENHLRRGGCSRVWVMEYQP